ncbi:MAG: hypothetical protein H0X29_08535 [Parachlamydiaceae bacterium]|nr:hypothetical protein [Parachlamydiaceae bacterium]
MKQTPPQSRHIVLWAVILCYFIPFIGLSSLGALTGHTQSNWLLLCISLLLSSMGSLGLYCIMAKWELSWKNCSVILSECIENPPAPIHIPTSEQNTACNFDADPALINLQKEIVAAEKTLQDTQQSNTQLQFDITRLIEEQQQLGREKKDFQNSLHKALNDLETYKQTCLQQQEQFKIYNNELQNQIIEYKQQVEKKQYQISHLETKVSDLTYEIKTLLQIAERHLEPSSPLSSDQNIFSSPSNNSASSNEHEPSDTQYEKLIASSEAASAMLKRCLDIAQKVTGSNRFNTQISSFLDSPANSFTLDLRRLCDTLRNESSSTVLLYSPKENQILFVNNHIRETTGWSPEKFTQNFNDIIQESLSDWRQSLANLPHKPETSFKLSLKTKSGSNLILKAHLGLIPTGIFRHYAIGILYP